MAIFLSPEAKCGFCMDTEEAKASADMLNAKDSYTESSIGDSSSPSLIFMRLFSSYISMCWVSGRIAKITTSTPGKEEIEIAPYFIGFSDNSDGRKPMTVTGRLRHTKDIITLNIESIISVQMLNETYTIPDNLKPFNKREKEDSYDAIDMIPLVLKVREKSALNSFSTIVHEKPEISENEDGEMICSVKVENSIELYLRLVQCGTSVEIISPESLKNKFVSDLKKIISLY